MMDRIHRSEIDMCQNPSDTNLAHRHRARAWRSAQLSLLMLAGLVGLALAESGEGPPRIGLALGSGGAGGLAHVAMLEVFEEQGLKPSQLSGTSIGAVVAALYAAGLDASAIRQLFEEFGGSALDPLSGLGNENSGPGWTDLLDIDFERGSLISSDRFIDFIAERFEARDFAELEIPLAIVATDFWSGEAVVLSEGELLPAIQASMAVPGLFAPVEIGDQLLIDGGASNPLPWDLLDAVDLKVAIDVTGSRVRNGEERPGLTELLLKSFEIMQQSIIREKRRHAEPDILIKPALSDVRLLHFDRVDDIIASVAEAKDDLREQLRKSIE
jgi:NTE family protein